MLDSQFFSPFYISSLTNLPAIQQYKLAYPNCKMLTFYSLTHFCQSFCVFPSDIPLEIRLFIQKPITFWPFINQPVNPIHTLISCTIICLAISCLSVHPCTLLCLSSLAIFDSIFIVDQSWILLIEKFDWKAIV